MSNKCLSLALHGGAGAKPGRSYDREITHMKGLVEEARDALRAGATALDVATRTVVALEASGLYVAGRGASPNLAGEYELDACIMDGLSGKAGSVAALQGFKSPITAARAVMERTPHVMLAGSGAGRFAAEQGLEVIDDPKAWFTHAGQFEANHAPGALAHGTVGCVVRDCEGRLAAATSTAGVFNKMPGRVGDSPIPAAGAWADGNVAVSCTGQGEYFIRLAAAAQIGFRVKFAGQSVEEAAKAVIAELAALGGDGGLIAVGADGSVATPFHSQGLKRATLTPDGAINAAAF
jgi:isoaspartyl peptidase/L-asparaginase-like protein (Ntn-hydrolase superfamily)